MHTKKKRKKNAKNQFGSVSKRALNVILMDLYVYISSLGKEKKSVLTNNRDNQIDEP